MSAKTKMNKYQQISIGFTDKAGPHLSKFGTNTRYIISVLDKGSRFGTVLDVLGQLGFVAMKVKDDAVTQQCYSTASLCTFLKGSGSGSLCL